MEKRMQYKQLDEAKLDDYANTGADDTLLDYTVNDAATDNSIPEPEIIENDEPSIDETSVNAPITVEPEFEPDENIDKNIDKNIENSYHSLEAEEKKDANDVAAKSHNALNDALNEKVGYNLWDTIIRGV